MGTLSRRNREFDLILFGATGNAGRAMVEYLSKCPEATSWAIAGRNKSKLEALKEKYDDGSCAVVVADCKDSKSMEAMAGRAKVVLSAAGPFEIYGEPVIQACIAAGTHYCDITGEVGWVVDMRAKYDKEARDAGVVICNFSGYDSIPAELSLAIAKENLGTTFDLVSAECTFNTHGQAGFPRGTILTMLKMLSPFALYREINKCVDFVPKAQRSRTLWALIRLMLPLWSKSAGGFTLPNFMGLVNIPVVYWSAHRLGYGEVEYSDRVPLPPSLTRWYTLWGLAIILPLYAFVGASYVVLMLPFVRTWIKGYVARSYSFGGEPKCLVEVTTAVRGRSAKALPDSGARGYKEGEITIRIPGDPGIYCTAMLACETAMGLAAKPRPEPGFTTPVVALGKASLAKRMEIAGMKVDCQLRGMVPVVRKLMSRSFSQDSVDSEASRDEHEHKFEATFEPIQEASFEPIQE